MSDRRCGTRLAPVLGDLVAALEAHDELALAPSVRSQLLALRAATVDRLLRPFRQASGQRPWGSSGASATIQRQNPLRTFGEWRDVQPGAVQADLVFHGGESPEGFSLTTLTVGEVATSWTEYQPVKGTMQQRVGTAGHHVRQRLPMGLRELHTDNGGEFLNAGLYPWCQREGIRFTRGRPDKKNDQASVEQKNGAVIRRLLATTGTVRRRPSPRCRGCMRSYGRTGTSANRSAGGSAKSGWGPRSSNPTRLPRRRTSGWCRRAS